MLKIRKDFRFLPLALIFTATFLLFTILMPSLASWGFNAQQPQHYTDLKFQPLPKIKIPEYTKFQLKNGMKVFLMEDRELPLIGGTALFHTGDRWEQPDKIGLAELTGDVMRTGGTKQHSPSQLNQILEQKAASVESGIGTTSGSVSFNALSEDLELVFNLFTEVIREPVFAQEKLDLAKVQQRGEISRRNDDPGGIASREFQKLIYGNNSPYSRTVEYKTLENIQRQDLVSFYQQYFHPNNMILGIVGDFDTQEMRKLIEKKFTDWQPNPQMQLPNLPSVSQSKQEGIFLVNQSQLTQSNIMMGHLGGQLNNPDYAALSVMNGVLNGFGGRLFNQVRSRQGLAYSVYGYWDAEYDYPGTFVAGGQTRSDATVPFIKAVLSELENIRTQPVTSAELTYAKESVLNSFVFNFKHPSQTLSRLMRYEYYGYPTDFIFRYQKGIESTTINDILRVAQKYLQPDKIVTLVVGNATDIKPPLTNITPKVNSIDITIPGAKSS